MKWSKYTTAYLNDELKIRNIHIALRVIGVMLFLYVALITSWISDDAQITFRQVLNFISGDGIVFNFGERVQAFTHPLWFFLLSGVISLTSEMFVTTSVLSIVISTFAILTLFLLELNLRNTVITYISPVLYLIFSFAFCDYMTSGLENPLSYLLLSILLFLLFKETLHKRMQFIFLVIALLILNRFDYVVLLLPLITVLIFSYPNKSELFKVLLPGIGLLVAWIIFATIYFGSPLPNTYFAKLNAGYPQSELFEKGINYLVSLKFDIASIMIIAMGFFSLFLYRDLILISLAIGKILYIGYIVYIGGDFMMGRFVSILILLSIGEILVVMSKSLISINIKNLLSIVLLIVFVIIGYFTASPLFSSTEHSMRAVYEGINDQRGAYYRFTGLYAKERQQWPKPEKFTDTPPEDYRVICGLIGATALTDVSNYHIDPCGLTDPFLSRIPANRHSNWRIGHHLRKIPTEYGLYKIGRISNIPDTELGKLLDDVSNVTQGELFSLDRFVAIWRLFFNSYQYLDYTKYTDPSIWVPVTNSIEVLEIDNWNEEIPHVNRPYYVKYFKQYIFNNNLKVESTTPMNSSIIWTKLNLNYTYDVFVNNIMIYTFDKNREYCANGVKIYLENEKSIKSITIKASDEINTRHQAFNYLEFLRLRESSPGLNFVPHCIVRL